ncbi:Inositol phoshorylceramide synthase regulatory subunit kei1 [Ophiocordyceps camponoti-floridani]|uniref:Inositol phoshorylceramide synthase regulatory subunit kei1 n=1 Tax=Ophiocordyceps camponoti-floridani TaxID=2030778 RepID=A0A8H4VC44_9HYPO|nr:Inositol phoshorylceramide synthase regulatory subunit kei1 [Ophiocordyceps camponoti-floridani]
MARFTRLMGRVPRPQSLFGVISLQTGTELIALAQVFNKVTGVYGLLAILTGYKLSVLQLSTYLYSIAILAVVVYLIPHVRRQSPVECLALAHVYLIDTIVNCIYTAAFGLELYSASTSISNAEERPSPSLSTIVTKGFSGLRREGDAPVKAAVPQETATSMLLIVGLTLLRIYFSTVVTSYAQQVIQRYAQIQAVESPGVDDEDGPFSPHFPAGEGRRGRMGRMLVSCGRGYWLGTKEALFWRTEWQSKPIAGATLAGEV